MVEYASQEAAIYARADELGISHDVIWDYFDKMVDDISNENPEKDPDFRLKAAEKAVWSKFCKWLPIAVRSTIC